MEQKDIYRLTALQKKEIAQNLIDILEINANVTSQTKRFIHDWILTGNKEKRKVFFDVWDIVLKNYMPKKSPILFRSCNRIGKDGKIASFTGRFECAKNFSNGKGSLIICDTKETLEFDKRFKKPGEYTNTFYPLRDVLIKAKKKGEIVFLDDYIGEDEYIMRIDLRHMHSMKWR